MKQALLFSAIIFLFFLSVNAQPVIHAAGINPTAGERVIEATAKIKAVKYPRTGPHVTWNYSKLADSSKHDTTYFVTAASTPYGSAFPGATLAAHSNTNFKSYVYYSPTNSALSVYGSASKNSNTVWMPPYRILAFPVSYGEIYSDACTVSSSGSTTTDQYKDTVDVVGYGTLKLPNHKVFKNVLMQKTTTVFIFVVNGQTIKNFSYSEDFIASGHHYPLLSISLDKNQVIDGIQYSVDAVTLAEKEETNQPENKTITAKNEMISVYPNPATTSLTINAASLLNKSVAGIIISDLSGKNIFIKKTNMASSETIDCSSFKAGIYFVRIQMNDGSETTQKVVITK